MLDSDQGSVTSKEAIEDSLDGWSTEIKSGTAFVLVGYTNKIVEMDRPSQSIEKLKARVTEMYNDHSNFIGNPNQTR